LGVRFLARSARTYDKLKEEIEEETPLHVVLADTTAVSSSDYLLEHITGLIRDSAASVLDVTGGNPNVSLEVGIAHAMPVDFLLTLYTRKPRTHRDAQQALEREGELKPIISDLQGRNRIEYKTYPALKKQLTSRYLNKLPYMKRWNQWKKHNASLVKHAIPIFDEVRASGRTLRPRVISMLDATGIHADDLLKKLSDARLLIVRRGRTGGIYYPTK